MSTTEISAKLDELPAGAVVRIATQTPIVATRTEDGWMLANGYPNPVSSSELARISDTHPTTQLYPVAFPKRAVHKLACDLDPEIWGTHGHPNPFHELEERQCAEPLIRRRETSMMRAEQTLQAVLNVDL